MRRRRRSSWTRCGARRGTTRSRISIRSESRGRAPRSRIRSEEHTSELQSPCNLVCRLLLEKKKKKTHRAIRIPSATAKVFPGQSFSPLLLTDRATHIGCKLHTPRPYSLQHLSSLIQPYVR